MDQAPSSSRLPDDIFDDVETIAVSCNISPLSDLDREELIAGVQRNRESVAREALQLAPQLNPGPFFQDLASLMTTSALRSYQAFLDDEPPRCVVHCILWNMVRFCPETVTPSVIDSLFQCLPLPAAPSGHDPHSDQSFVERMAGLLLACLRLPENRDRLLEVLGVWLEGGAGDCFGEDCIAAAALAVGCLGCHAHTPAVREQLERRVSSSRWKIQVPALWPLGQLGGRRDRTSPRRHDRLAQSRKGPAPVPALADVAAARSVGCPAHPLFAWPQPCQRRSRREKPGAACDVVAPHRPVVTHRLGARGPPGPDSPFAARSVDPHPRDRLQRRGGAGGQSRFTANPRRPHGPCRRRRPGRSTGRSLRPGRPWIALLWIVLLQAFCGFPIV